VPEEEPRLVPPLKILRRRVNGVYRADGFAGPTRRYVLLVAMLVGLASLPTLAAITAGGNELADGDTGALDVPFLPPASPGAVIPVVPDPPTADPSSPDSSVPARPNIRGQAGERKTKPFRYAPAKNPPNRRADGSSSSSGKHTTPVRRDPPGSGGGPGTPGKPGAGTPGKPGPGRWHPRPTDPESTDPDGRDDDSRDHDNRDHDDRNDDSKPPRHRPSCHERGSCGSHERRHHRPDWTRHRQCESATHRAHWSHHREVNIRFVAVEIPPTGRHGVAESIRERADRPTRPSRLFRSITSHRSSDRSHRRSTMTERPHNSRPAGTAERLHNSRWHATDDAPRAYRGSHRAQSMHRAEDSAYARSTRMGRHHAGQDHHRDRSDWR
jgi:hypothetical protein